MYRYLPLLLIALASLAQGEEFTSPNSRTEQCRILPPMPGVTLSKSDQAKEKELCGIDFYGGAVALCPKTWSTSAAVMAVAVGACAVAAGSDPAHEAEWSAEQDGLTAVLNTLPPAQRACWLLREMHGRSYAEIGVTLKISPTTVRGTLARARHQIAEGMSPWR